MEVQDDRTAAQRGKLTSLIVGTDSFLSGWGGAEGGASYAAWACTSEDEPTVLDWVESRSDMKRIRVLYDPPHMPYRPNSRHCAHLHIYVVKPSHPSVERKNSRIVGGAISKFFRTPSPLHG